MSDTIIRDGTGTGSRAKVDSQRRLRTLSTMRSEIRHKSEFDGLAFRVFTAPLSVPATEAAVLRIAPSATGTRHLHIETILIYWNGGDTNHNRTLIGKIYGGMPAPTANYTSPTPLNLNLTKNSVAEAGAQTWDGVGSGMTVAANGLLVGTGYFAQGQSEIEVDGSLILGPGDVLGFTMQGEEAGKGSLVVTFYEEDEEET